MNIVQEKIIRKERSTLNVLKMFFCSIFTLLFFVANAYSWSSMKSFGGFLGTHQFINKKAYKEIRKHPAFNYSNFPSLQDIQDHGSISIKKTGLGPDVDGNSYFTQHWYNPANQQGNAPKTIKTMHGSLIRALNRVSGNYTEEQARNNKAHLASYSAHYIQDMTCPMHISGMNGSEVYKYTVGSSDDISPYAKPYTKKEWGLFVDRYNAAKDEFTDFFDPLYYNGDMIFSTFGGSHVLYEAHVETVYHKESSSKKADRWKKLENDEGYIPDDFKDGITDMEKLAIAAATETRKQIGTRDAPGRLWINNESEQTILATIKIPYDEWWRAVQLTYVTWRSSFSALHSASEDVKFVKVPNKPGKYKLSISVDNLEPDAPAKNVKIKYEIEGDIRAKGKISDIGTIEKYETSGWFHANKLIHIDDPKKISGKIIIEITGTYDKAIPDSGLKRVEYNLEDILVEAITMPDVLHYKKDTAVENSLGLFNVAIKSAGKPKSKDMEFRIKSQTPAFGEWVAPGENVVIDVYDKYTPPEDPNQTDDDGNPPNTGAGQNDPDTGDSTSREDEKKCKDIEAAITAFLNKVKAIEKETRSLESKIKKISNYSDELNKDSSGIKSRHREAEKKTVKITESAHELEKLSLKVCEATNDLNDQTIADSDHERNYAWISDHKTNLKDRLNSVKKLLKEASLHQEESKIKIGKLKKLTHKLQTGFQQLEQEYLSLKKKSASENQKLVELSRKAAMVSDYNCSQQVTDGLNEVIGYNQMNQEKLAQMTTLYISLKSDFEKKLKVVEDLDQVYQKTAYLIDLSKAYVERAESAAVKGAFCIVLADGIMEWVFIPDVIGIDIGTAQQMVSRKGLSVNKSDIGRPPSKGEAGRVKEVIPGITKRVKKGTLVTLSYYEESPDKDSLLANTDCSRWPGSQPVWDKQTDKPACGCPGDTVWNQNRSACISSRQAVLDTMDCSQFPGTTPGYDNNGNPMCLCPGGLPWVRDLNRCATQEDIAMASVDCSPYPGSVPGWDPQNNKATCECPYGTLWDAGMGKCVDKQELAIANTDCSHMPGSAPVWSYISNRPECECQSPYTRDPLTGKCVDLMAQLAQNQRDFDEEMANNQRRNDQMQQEFFNNMMGLFTQPSQPSQPGNYNTGQEICGDGIDNNGNNEIDEGCQFRLEIILDDNECEDDTMGLVVDGQHHLGNNPPGNKRHFNLTGLSRGRHTVQVIGVRSGGKSYGCNDTDVITFSIEFGSGIKSIKGYKKISGKTREGQSKTYHIMVQ